VLLAGKLRYNLLVIDTKAVRALANEWDSDPMEAARVLRQCADEIDRLQAGGCARNQRTTQYCATAMDLQKELDALRGQALSDPERQEYFAMKEDAARYRWLQFNVEGVSWCVTHDGNTGSSDWLVGPELDAAIDRARKGTT